jgi:uncharacterized protein
MKRTLSLLVGATLVALAAAAFTVVGRAGSARGDASTPSTVTVTGHGVVTAVPDEAVVTAGVRSQAASATAALAESARLETAVIGALKRAGGSDLQTQEVSLYPQTDGSGDVRGYVAENSVSAKATIAAAGALVDAAVGAGANNVSGPSLDVSDRDALYRQALRKAVASARAKAQALAEAGGFSLGAVTSVTESGETPVPEPVRTAAFQAASTPVEPGSQEIAADAVVSFARR